MLTASIRRDDRVPLFPLQGKFTLAGLVAAAVAAVLFQSILAAFAFFLVFACGGAVWRRGESFLAFCVACQWMEFVMGFLYQQATGIQVGYATSRELEAAVLFSLIGLAALTVGLRLGMRVAAPWTRQRWNRLQQTPPYDLQKLFYCSVAVSLFNCLVSITPMAVWFEAAQIIGNLLKLTGLFLLLLLFAVVRTRRGYHYALIALLLAWLPSMASHMSSFSGVFIVVLIVLTSEWRPWEWRPRARLHSRRVFRWAVLTAATLVCLAIFWIGGMKGEWRPRVLSGEVSGRPIDKAQEFMRTALRVAPQVEPDQAARGLAGRLASATDYFGLIITRVPAVVAHEDGKLTLRALYHITHPRILFPNKINMGSDSPFVIKYAGVPAAGEESGTSVGIGYMAEFYVDFGVPWMWLAVLVYGLVVGLLYECTVLFARSYDMYRVMTMATLAAFSGSGGNLAKNFGGMLQSWMIFAAVFLCVGYGLHRWLRRVPHGLPPDRSGPGWRPRPQGL